MRRILSFRGIKKMDFMGKKEVNRNIDIRAIDKNEKIKVIFASENIFWI
jgi:hypothetical protein